MELLGSTLNPAQNGKEFLSRNWKTIQACLIQREKDYALVRKGGAVADIPVCSFSALSEERRKKLLDDAPVWLKTFPSIQVPKDDSDVEKKLEEYMSDLLNPEKLLPDFSKTHEEAVKWADKVIDHLKLNVSDRSPTYYSVISKFLMLRNRFDEGFHYLYSGALAFPYNPELSYLLGYYSIHLNRDFRGGLKHLTSATEKARSNQQQIDLLPDDRELNEKDRTILRMWFSRAQDCYTLRSARYTALSSMPLQGRREFVSNEEVDAWLSQTFPDGHGGNDLSTLLRFAEQSKPVPQSTVSALVCRVQNRVQKVLEKISLTDARVSITEFLNAFRKIRCPNSQVGNIDSASSFEGVDFQNTTPCGDIHQEQPVPTSSVTLPSFNANQCFAKLQLAIRELLAPKTAVAYARAQARKLYESHSDTQPGYPPYLWERADVYGLIVLLDAVRKECPQRDEDIRTALRLFHVAGASIRDDGRLNGNNPLFQKGVKTRIAKLENAAKELTCSRRHMD